jgi:hypothetical protein
MRRALHIKKQFGFISLNFNPLLAEKMVRNILGHMNVVELAKEVVNNIDENEKVKDIKNQLWNDLKAYCQDYDKDATAIFNEFTTKIAKGEPCFKKYMLVG